MMMKPLKTIYNISISFDADDRSIFMEQQSYSEIHLNHTGKISDKWSLYLQEYNRLFSEFRNDRINLLEIGVQNGGSLEVLAKYFSAALTIVGCDIDVKCAELRYTDPRISLVVGDALDTEIQNKISKLTRNFDLIIDDGSHNSFEIINTFLAYFQKLNHGGLYIVEDLHCSYWQEFDGGLFNPKSSISFFKALIDAINKEHWGVDDLDHSPLFTFSQINNNAGLEDFVKDIHSIEFINSLCVIRKSPEIKNLLGKRIIVGELAIVDEGAISGVFLTPNQKDSVWNRSIDDEHKSIVVNFQAEVERLQTEINDFQAEINGFQAEVGSLKKEKIDFEAEVASLKKEKIDFQVEINDFQAEINGFQAEVGSLKKEKIDFEAEVASLKKEKIDFHAEVTRMQTENLLLSSQLQKFFRSKTWRYTSPIRSIVKFLRKTTSLKMPSSYLQKIILNVRRIPGLFLFIFFSNNKRFVLNFLRDIRKTVISDNQSADSSLNSPSAVVYLARGQSSEELNAIKLFSESLRLNSAGTAYDLFIVYKGFHSKEEYLAAKVHFEKIQHQEIQLEDDGFDIKAYSRVAREISNEQILFLNTFSKIEGEDWLKKLETAFSTLGVGLVGCTSSFDSLNPLNPLFPKFPNPHVRTNAFLVSRQDFMEITHDFNATTKWETLLFESGEQSLTNLIERRGKSCVVVGKNAGIYTKRDWPASATFRFPSQRNLLISDNQTRLFADLTLLRRILWSYAAWGNR
jgi:hypothetical protein